MTSFIGAFHVIFVHFPVALLTTSVLCYIFALFNKSSLSVFIKFYSSAHGIHITMAIPFRPFFCTSIYDDGANLKI